MDILPIEPHRSMLLTHQDTRSGATGRKLEEIMMLLRRP
jgi:hypothetical protein